MFNFDFSDVYDRFLLEFVMLILYGNLYVI